MSFFFNPSGLISLLGLHMLPFFQIPFGAIIPLFKITCISISDPLHPNMAKIASPSEVSMYFSTGCQYGGSAEWNAAISALYFLLQRSVKAKPRLRCPKLFKGRERFLPWLEQGWNFLRYWLEFAVYVSLTAHVYYVEE